MDEAVRLTNGTRYGLGSTVFAKASGRWSSPRGSGRG